MGHLCFLRNIERRQNLSVILVFMKTINVYPDFEGLDGQAIKKAFKSFEIKSLKDTRVTGNFRLFIINQYISKVDLKHLQHERRALCDNSL